MPEKNKNQVNSNLIVVNWNCKKNKTAWKSSYAKRKLWLLYFYISTLIKNVIVTIILYIHIYIKSFKCRHSANVVEITKYLWRIHNLFFTNKLSLQLEALSNCDNFILITILYNNDVLAWDYKNNNKYQVTMS